MNNILILGASGNLGTQLKFIFPKAITWDSNDVDVTNFEVLENKILSCSDLSIIINCVAYNDVDGAESNEQLAFLLNRDVPKKLADLAKQSNSILIHFSTGYVFSGRDKIEHLENDAPDPISTYGKSKAAGEQEILKIAGRNYIIRTNLLFGPAGTSSKAKPNVIDTMRRIGIEKRKLNGITDEYCNFSYTPDLAEATGILIHKVESEKLDPGIYHLTNEGYGSWYELAKAIFENMGWEIFNEGDPTKLAENAIIIQPISSANYPRPAKRPKSAVIINTKLDRLRAWQDALKDYLNTL